MLRFGIKEGQKRNIIPQAGKPELLEHYVSAFDHSKLVCQMVDQGFHLIELGGDLVVFFPNSFSPESVEKLQAVKQERQLNYTLHLPLWSVEPSTPLQPVREGSVKAVVQCIKDSLPLNPERYVLHATGPLAAEFSHMEPESARPLVLSWFQRNARESIRQILLETGIPSRLLAIETIEFPFDLTFQIAEELDLSMCLDTGHVLVGFSGPFELFDVLEKVLPRLGEIHLHDGVWQGPEHNIGYGKDHKPLGTCDLDVARLLDRLDQAGWDGPIIFELTPEQALASLEVVRALRPNLIHPHFGRIPG